MLLVLVLCTTASLEDALFFKISSYYVPDKWTKLWPKEIIPQRAWPFFEKGLKSHTKLRIWNQDSWFVTLGWTTQQTLRNTGDIMGVTNFPTPQREQNLPCFIWAIFSIGVPITTFPWLVMHASQVNTHLTFLTYHCWIETSSNMIYS